MKRANRASFRVGFRLETDTAAAALLRKAAGLLRAAHCDLVVANSKGRDGYRGYIIDKNHSILSRGRMRETIAKNLVKIIKERL